MPKFEFHMGVTLRCYGRVEVEAADLQDAMKMVTADYLAENIILTETTTDSGQELCVLDASDGETGQRIDGCDTINLPSEYDVDPWAIPANPVIAARNALKALAYARDCLKAAECGPRVIDKVRTAIASTKGAVRNVENREGRTDAA